MTSPDLAPCQFPDPLEPGDLITVIAPSANLGDRHQQSFYQGLEVLKRQGYRVQLDGALWAASGYLAGTDAQRRRALETAWLDPHCRGIFCGRGGYGAARLLENWPWPHPSGDRKWLIGFSDVTALLWHLARHGIGTVHGPVMVTLAEESPRSHQRLFQFLQGQSLDPLMGTVVHPGQAQGILLPGNLTVATHLLGTPSQPPLGNVILAWEDVGEAPYRLDRLLTQWRSGGFLAQVRGIVLGRFSDCAPPSGYPSFSLGELFRDRLGDLGIPVVADLPFGHGGENQMLPVGQPVTLDGDRGVLHFQSSGVL